MEWIDASMPRRSTMKRETIYLLDLHLAPDSILQVTCGYASAALTQFLSTGLTHVQLARMRKAVDTGTGQVSTRVCSVTTRLLAGNKWECWNLQVDS